MGNACNFATDDEEMHFENQVRAKSKSKYTHNSQQYVILSSSRIISSSMAKAKGKKVKAWPDM